MKLSLDILPFFIWVCGVYGLHLWFLSFGVSNSLSLLVLWSCYLGCEIYDFFVRFVKYIWVFVNNLVFNLFRLMLVVKHCWGLLGRRYEKHCIIQIHTSIGPSIPVVALHDMYMYIYIYTYISCIVSCFSFVFWLNESAVSRDKGWKFWWSQAYCSQNMWQTKDV